MKKKLTLSVEDKLIDLARLDNINLSRLLEEYLSKYLETNGIEEISKKIQATETELQALIDRKKDLLRTGKTESRVQQVENRLMKDMIDRYAKRRETYGNDKDADITWITGPKNQERCRLLQRDPLDLIVELREIYKKRKP